MLTTVLRCCQQRRCRQECNRANAADNKQPQGTSERECGCVLERGAVSRRRENGAFQQILHHTHALPTPTNPRTHTWPTPATNCIHKIRAPTCQWQLHIMTVAWPPPDGFSRRRESTLTLDTTPFLAISPPIVLVLRSIVYL